MVLGSSVKERAVKKVCLIVMDGWGISPNKGDTMGDATLIADTPNLDTLLKEYPSTEICASGPEVGLPEGQMGNSEVGHLTLGAGRIIYQELTKINRAAEDGSLKGNAVLQSLFDSVKAGGGRLHLMGLLSDGGVHSHETHLYTILEAAREYGLDEAYIHAFLDGRDTPPESGKGYLERLESELERIGVGTVATLCGRFYAMDRDNRWDRVEKAYKAITSVGNNPLGVDPLEVIDESYLKGEGDEFVIPTVIGEGGEAERGRVTDNDVVLFFNFRSDRVREIVSVFTDDSFSGFARKVAPRLADFGTMTKYGDAFDCKVLFPQEEIRESLGEVLSKRGIKQFRTSETEKYPHVTFFFNGGSELEYSGEDRLLIPSRSDVATYDLAPEMCAEKIGDAVVGKIESGDAEFILVNFANGDMVGHTGIVEAAVRGCEAVDKAIGRVVDAGVKAGWTIVITADHGNSEELIDFATDTPITAHTTNPVPLIIVDRESKGAVLKEGGGLKDVGPTVLKVMGIEPPTEMEGEALI